MSEEEETFMEGEEENEEVATEPTPISGSASVGISEITPEMMEILLQPRPYSEDKLSPGLKALMKNAHLLALGNARDDDIRYIMLTLEEIKYHILALESVTKNSDQPVLDANILSCVMYSLLTRARKGFERLLLAGQPPPTLEEKSSSRKKFKFW